MIEEIEINDWIEVKEPATPYELGDSINSTTYKIIGLCFEVYNQLGKGFLEIVYKDALQHEFKQNNILFEREKRFEITYKNIVLPHYYYADFLVANDVILEVKAQQGVVEEHSKQVLNYLAVSKCKIGLLVNFGEDSLRYKRLILTK